MKTYIPIYVLLMYVCMYVCMCWALAVFLK